MLSPTHHSARAAGLGSALLQEGRRCRDGRELGSKQPTGSEGCQEIKGLADALGKEKGSVSGTVTGGV